MKKLQINKKSSDLQSINVSSKNENIFSKINKKYSDLQSINVGPYSSLPYNIILPEYNTTLLTALQHNGEKGVFATFDPDTEHCVVDNCANVHIWNNFLWIRMDRDCDCLPTSALTTVTVYLAPLEETMQGGHLSVTGQAWA